ncbi:MAG: rRNA maturation RNase YbeY [Eubacteriales bacterium]
MNRKMSLRIYFENEQEKIPVTYNLKMLLREAIETTLDFEDFRNVCEVSVTFTDNEGIRELNRKFRGIDKPTDVLSFPLFDYEGDCEEPPVDEMISNLGDIVISLERAQEQAEEYGHGFKREVAFLTVHSMLHLLGYDHEKSEEEDRDMRSKQTEIMRIMGLEVK